MKYRIKQAAELKTTLKSEEVGNHKVGNHSDLSEGGSSA